MIQVIENSSSTIITNITNHPRENEVKKKIRLKMRKIRKNKQIELTKEGYKMGKWQRDEHLIFIKACEKHGNNWTKIQQELKTRSSAQIRSHAQKYVIKLCKMYHIKLKSKKFKKKSPKHLEYNNKAKLKQVTGNNQELGGLEKKLLDTFNYYNREYKPFSIEKIHKSHEHSNCILSNDNKKTEYRLKNQIFLIQKIKKKNYQTLFQNEKLKSDEIIKYKFLENLVDLCNFNYLFLKNISSIEFQNSSYEKLIPRIEDNINNINNRLYVLNYNLLPDVKILFDIFFNEKYSFGKNELDLEKNILKQVNQSCHMSNDCLNFNKPDKEI